MDCCCNYDHKSQVDTGNSLAIPRHFFSTFIFHSPKSQFYISFLQRLPTLPFKFLPADDLTWYFYRQVLLHLPATDTTPLAVIVPVLPVFPPYSWVPGPCSLQRPNPLLCCDLSPSRFLRASFQQLSPLLS